MVDKLWDSWEDDAVILDRESGDYFDPTKVHAIDHAATTSGCKGPLQRAALAAGPAGLGPGRLVQQRPRLRRPQRRGDLHRAPDARRRPGVLRRHQDAARGLRPQPRARADPAGHQPLHRRHRGGGEGALRVLQQPDRARVRPRPAGEAGRRLAAPPRPRRAGPGRDLRRRRQRARQQPQPQAGRRQHRRARPADAARAAAPPRRRPRPQRRPRHPGADRRHHPGVVRERRGRRLQRDAAARTRSCSTPSPRRSCRSSRSAACSAPSTPARRCATTTACPRPRASTPPTELPSRSAS